MSLAAQIVAGILMGTKVKNHTVTRGYLAGWKDIDGTGKVGLWYFDIASREVVYSPSVNASFAVTKAIYAPKFNGRRDVPFPSG